MGNCAGRGSGFGGSITERGWPPLTWTRPDGYKFCADSEQLQTYEVAVIRGKLTEIRRFITGTVAPHAALHPKGRWIRPAERPPDSFESGPNPSTTTVRPLMAVL